MKKAVSALLTAFFAINAHAGQIIIDSFDDGDQSISLSGTDTNAFRTLSTRLLASANPVSSTVEVSFGSLTVTNGSGEASEVTVSWDLAPNLVPAGAKDLSFLFTIVESDANATDLAFSFNGSSLASFAIPGNTVDEDVQFGISGGVLDAGGVLELVINGNPGWDLQLDAFGLAFTDPDVPPNPIPEPATLALVGLGLLGAGALRRRR